MKKDLKNCRFRFGSSFNEMNQLMILIIRKEIIMKKKFPTKQSESDW